MLALGREILARPQVELLMGPVFRERVAAAVAQAGQVDVICGLIADRDIDDVVVTFTDRKMTLSGNVRAPEGSRNAESTVLVVPANVDGWIAAGMSPRRTATAYVPATGVYQLQILLPGDYVVAALPPEVEPSMDPDFLRRIVAQGARVSVAPGESKTLPLTILRAR